MKLNRILSLALVMVMLVTSFAAIIPVKAEAAFTSEINSQRLSLAEVESIIKDFKAGKNGKTDPLTGLADTFDDAYERLEYELEKGYLDKSSNGKFTIYVNRYTGVMYYQNNATGEMLTSNPFDFPITAGTNEELFSQIVIKYSTVTDTETNKTMYSSVEAAGRNQITVTRIDGGLRVNYSMGNTATRALVPSSLTAESMENNILRPALETLEEMLKELIKSDEVDSYFSEKYYNKEEIDADSLIHFFSLSSYQSYVKSIINGVKGGKYNKNGVNASNAEVKQQIRDIESFLGNIMDLFMKYTAINPSTMTEAELKNYSHIPAVVEGKSIYINDEAKLANLAKYAKIIKKIAPNYTFDVLEEDETECGYVVEKQTEPVFRLALEYTINDDGTLSVRLPSNSIVFDETKYILKGITPLQYFGSANFERDGYVFVPDGSGAVIEFKDYVKSNVAMSLNAYGQDYCYSQLTGSIYGQNVTMPVYGVSSQAYQNGELINTGFFAVLEEGASTATINVSYTSSTYFEGSVYTTFQPYPTDRFDLSDTISVGGNQFYSIVAESKYAGSYVTRYVMLSDKAENSVGKGTDVRSYVPTYVGMAEFYRNYLIETGVISELENVSYDLPLYIEALGSIEVVEKILTFPVNVSRAITTFDNVIDMYNELSTAKADAKARLDAKAAEYQALADAEENASRKSEYQKKADDFTALSAKIVDIDNINFKLTGFANGGMYSTYPTKLKWERVLGGKRDFKNLLEVAKSNTGSDSNFGVYPDFDFQYISNTAMFDGVGKHNTASKMVDNRYASKQAYSNISGEFDTIYSLLISPDSLDRLYNKFIKKYSKYNATGISVSTLGSDLNSNFDEENPVSRDDSQRYVCELLDRIANESGYSVMMAKGNIYAAKYADHILEVATDSSYYRYSSYTVPFVGMMLHGYVSYTGTAFNYSGSPDYDFLRAIESGAALYYILGYQNTDLMKDDEELNKYYSVSYENWFDSIVETYAKLNAEIGDIPDYKIVDHKILIGERVIDASEVESNLNALKNEFIGEVDKAINSAIDAAYDAMFGVDGEDGRGIKLNVDIDALVALAHEKFELEADELLGDDFKAALTALVDSYKNEIKIDDTNGYEVAISSVEYESAYRYVTGSYATDGKNYEKTDYTSDLDLIVMVTYKNNEGKTRTFILNYNIYAVEINLPGAEKPIIIEKYGFYREDK